MCSRDLWGNHGIRAFHWNTGQVFKSSLTARGSSLPGTQVLFEHIAELPKSTHHMEINMRACPLFVRKLLQ